MKVLKQGPSTSPCRWVFVLVVRTCSGYGRVYHPRFPSNVEHKRTPREVLPAQQPREARLIQSFSPKPYARGYCVGARECPTLVRGFSEGPPDGWVCASFGTCVSCASAEGIRCEPFVAGLTTQGATLKKDIDTACHLSCFLGPGCCPPAFPRAEHGRGRGTPPPQPQTKPTCIFIAAASIFLSLIFFPAAADWAFIQRAFALADFSSFIRLTFIDRSPTASILDSFIGVCDVVLVP